jgi:hypothetical protein
MTAVTWKDYALKGDDANEATSLTKPRTLAAAG